MNRTVAGLLDWWRRRWSAQGDRGEAGPIVYALMTAFVVLLVGAVIIWATDLSESFMGELDEFDFDDPRGEGSRP